MENTQCLKTSRIPGHVAVTFPRHYSWLRHNLIPDLTPSEKLVIAVDILHRVLNIAEYLLNRGIRIVTLDYLPRYVLEKLNIDLSVLEDTLVKVLARARDVHVRCYLFDESSSLTLIKFVPEDADRKVNLVIGYDHKLELKYMLLRALADCRLSRLDLDMETLEQFVNTCRSYSILEEDPDLVIVFGDEHTPNFLIYNLSYSELVFIDKFLYEITFSDLENALETYQRRTRRFGR